jgi:GNAT superfamily N-acetyltransferase
VHTARVSRGRHGLDRFAARRALYAEEYGWTTEYEALAAEIVAQFLKNFDSTRERCWIAECNAARVGAVMIVKHSETVAKLRLLHVERAACGLGIGKRLVDECIRFSRTSGYHALVGLDAGSPQIIQPPQDVVVPARGERDLRPRGIDDLSG